MVATILAAYCPLLQKTVKPSPHAPEIIAFIVVRLFTACGKC
jgi:hypothetical protein